MLYILFQDPTSSRGFLLLLALPGKAGEQLSEKETKLSNMKEITCIYGFFLKKTTCICGFFKKTMCIYGFLRKRSAFSVYLL